MAEEAVIRIRFEGDGGQPQASVRVPPPPPSPPAGAPPRRADAFLDVLGKVRGTLGGMFGPLAGAALDAAIALRTLRSSVPTAPQTVPAAKAPAVPTARQARQMAAPAPNLPPIKPAPVPGVGGQPSPYPGFGGAGQIPQTMPAPAHPVPTQQVEQAEAGAEAALPIIGAVLGAVNTLGREIEAQTTAAVNFRNALISASTSPGEYIDSIGQTVKAFASSVPIIGGFLGAIAEATFSIGSFMKAVDEVADRYSAFSPEIAVAQSMADVAQTLGDLRRAQEIGPDIADFINEESQLRQQFEDEKIKLLRAMLPLATDAMKVLNMIVPVIKFLTDFFLVWPSEAFKAVLDAVMAWFGVQANKPDLDFDIPGMDILQGTPFRFGPEGAGVAPGV